MALRCWRYAEIGDAPDGSNVDGKVQRARKERTENGGRKKEGAEAGRIPAQTLLPIPQILP